MVHDKHFKIHMTNVTIFFITLVRKSVLYGKVFVPGLFEDFRRILILKNFSYVVVSFIT